MKSATLSGNFECCWIKRKKLLLRSAGSRPISANKTRRKNVSDDTVKFIPFGCSVIYFDASERGLVKHAKLCKCFLLMYCRQRCRLFARSLLQPTHWTYTLVRSVANQIPCQFHIQPKRLCMCCCCCFWNEKSNCECMSEPAFQVIRQWIYRNEFIWLPCN